MFLSGIEKTVSIDNVHHRLLTDIEIINRFFQGQYNSSTNYGKDGFFQLGWHSAMIVVHDGAVFKPQALVDLNNRGNLPIDGAYPIIVTRAVDSCSFVCAHKGDKYLLAHIDSCQKENSRQLDILCEMLKEFNGGDAFVSRINGESKLNDAVVNAMRIKHSDEERAKLVPEDPVFLEPTFIEPTPDSPTAIYVRNVHNVEKDKQFYDILNCFSHIEIGLCVEKGVPTVFGEVSNRRRGDGEIPCYCFCGLADMKEKIKLLQRDLPEKGGSCTIL